MPEYTPKERFLYGQVTLSERLRMEYAEYDYIKAEDIGAANYINWLENRVWCLECEIFTISERKD